MFNNNQIKDHLRKIIKAKAFLYENGDEMKLIEKAVRAYNPEIEEERCMCGGGNLKLEFKDRTKTVFVDTEPTDVIIRNAPALVCDFCGEEYYPLKVYVFIEKEIENDILAHLRARKEPPREYDFINEFLNAKEK